ncbi:DASH complex subunit Duo1-domain-containing protein [Myxozyma melibiosi]|uniref:DASH complex subunit DUO1 n=1 Tax=Myxozyma melibiosi TaxID=54550 RepID=A0ABR1F0F3_9ASCO
MPADTDNLAATLQDLAVSLQAFEQQQQQQPQQSSTPGQGYLPTGDNDDATAYREERLLLELEQVKAMNASIDTVLDSIRVAESNLDRVTRTTRNVDSLLDLWIRILSQTEHTQRLVFDSEWEGATKDEQLHQARLIALAAQQAQARANAERRAQEAALANQKKKEAEELKRRRDAVLQKRIYGNKLGGGAKPAASKSTSSAPSTGRRPISTSSSRSTSSRSTGLGS